MSGTTASWTPERRAMMAGLMSARNRDPNFVARKLAGKHKRQARPHAVPDHTHPCVRGVFIECNEQRATFVQIAARVNIDRCVLQKWRVHMPRLDTIDAVLNALDLELAIVPIGTRDENGFIKKRPYKRRVSNETV